MRKHNQRRTMFVVGMLYFVLYSQMGEAAVNTYDSLCRLTQVAYTNGTTIAYTYDHAGNRLTLVTQVGPPPSDTTPPIPSPSTWATAPYATGSNIIQMAATTATDASGVQYFFHCLTAGGHDSGWQTGATYQDVALFPNTTYSYQVMTRDQSANQNTGSYSATQSATTQASGIPTRVISLCANLYFGNVITGRTAQSTLQISNRGTLPLTVTGINCPNGFSGSYSGTVSTGSPVNVTITFAPMATNTYGGQVSVNSDADGGASSEIVAGTGVALPDSTFVLHTFGSFGDGQTPYNSVLLVKTNLYGTTVRGGTGGRGTVFRMNTDGTGYSIIHNFAGGTLDGADPQDAMMTDGTWLYGVTWGGGSADDGVLYRMSMTGSNFSVLHTFTGVSDGMYPTGTPFLDTGVLYGTSRNGATGNNGVVWRCNTNGTGFSVIHTFTGGTSDASRPYAGVIMIGPKLYGTAGSGGSSNKGVVFRMNADGSSYEDIHGFSGGPSDGYNPCGAILCVGDTLYGTAPNGGASGNGMLYKMQFDGSGYTHLHDFAGGGGDGANPYGTLTLAGGRLYGTTAQGGTNNMGVIFSCDTNGAMYSIERVFAGGTADGAAPYGALATDDVYLYGMTSSGGTLNQGIVFRLPLTPIQTQQSLSAFQLWQIAYFGSTTASGSGPTEDSDHDGMNNYQEFIAGTNPNDANSRFAIKAISSNADNNWRISFDIVAGKSYTVTWKTNLLDGLEWTFYTNFTGLNGSTNVVVPDSLPQAFFKIQVE